MVGLPEFAASGLVIYLVRHGETPANQERRYEGRGDGDLTEKGLSQAQNAATALEGAGIRAVYSSPRRRALRTVHIIADRLGIVPVILDGLAEVDFGEWEGLTYEEISLRDPQRLQRWLADPLHGRPPGGESLTEMWSRVRRCMAEIVLAHSSTAAAHSGQGAVAVVSHGGPIRAILSYSRHGDLRGFWDTSILPGEIRPVWP